MALAQEDIDLIKTQVGEYVKDNLGLWLAEQSLGKPPVVYEIELRERMVRVEEALKNQGDLMREGFNQMEKRFEQIDKRLEQVDKRLDMMKADMDKRFDLMKADMDKRFEQVDKRFESMHQDIRSLQLRMDNFMRWSFGITMGTGGLIIGILKLWP